MAMNRRGRLYSFVSCRPPGAGDFTRFTRDRAIYCIVPTLHVQAVPFGI